MRFTSITQTTGIGQNKVQVSNPVADALAAPEGHHDQFIRFVDSHESSSVAEIMRSDKSTSCSIGI
jgi:hypothetical protein